MRCKLTLLIIIVVGQLLIYHTVYILYRIAMLNKEASSLWPGNEKIHIKGDTGNLLKMEEFLAQKVPECTISEIGFGRGE